jgi:hypothetical protein
MSAGVANDVAGVGFLGRPGSRKSGHAAQAHDEQARPARAETWDHALTCEFGGARRPQGKRPRDLSCSLLVSLDPSSIASPAAARLGAVVKSLALVSDKSPPPVSMRTP